MEILQKYRNKEIAIYGMGITGFSAAKILKNLNFNLSTDKNQTSLDIRSRLDNVEGQIKVNRKEGHTNCP